MPGKTFAEVQSMGWRAALSYLAALITSGTYEDGATPFRPGGTVVQLAPVMVDVIASGAVAAGKRCVEFTFSSDFAGTILGAAFAGPRDLTYSFPLLPPGNSYGAIAYTITAGSARIVSF